jgi:hypothetical protein
VLTRGAGRALAHQLEGCSRALGRTWRCVDGPGRRFHPAALRLDKLCSLEFRYLDFHFLSPRGTRAGRGWGIGEGIVSGERLSATIKWSNHPSLRCDGVALPDSRGG